MNRSIATLIVVLVLAVASIAAADSSSSGILLTAGTVKRVDFDTRVVVLDSGRRLEARRILKGGEFVELRVVRPEDEIFLSGRDLGYQPAVARSR